MNREEALADMQSVVDRHRICPTHVTGDTVAAWINAMNQPPATVTLPKFEGCGTTVSAADAIRRFCQLQARVSKHFGSREPNDCFCQDYHQGMGAGTFESGYRNALASFAFIEQATINALEADRATVAMPPKPEGVVGG